MSGHWLAIAVVVVLVILSGLSAGLEVGLFSIDSIFLRVWSKAGDENQKKMSQKLITFFNRYHWTLVALILFNASCMMTLPIVLDSIVDPITALILSITVVLFVGEVIPLAFFVRHAIPICAFFSPVIWGSIIVTAPLSYPVGRLLDYILGSHEEILDRDELAALILPPAVQDDGRDEDTMEVEIECQRKGVSFEPSRRASTKSADPESLTDDAFRLRQAEIRMLQGAMLLTQDTVVNHMHTTTENIFMLSSQQPLDGETIEAIIRSGYSRIPVYFGDDHRHVIGALIVNSLVKLCFANPDPPPLVSNYPLREVMRLSESATLYDAYMAFREGISNMAVVYNNIGVMLGLLTLTDVLTALYQGDPGEGKIQSSTHGARRTDKIVGVMEGMKFLSQTKHIETFLVTADGKATVAPQVDETVKTAGGDRFPSIGSPAPPGREIDRERRLSQQWSTMQQITGNKVTENNNNNKIIINSNYLWFIIIIIIIIPFSFEFRSSFQRRNMFFFFCQASPAAARTEVIVFSVRSTAMYTVTGAYVSLPSPKQSAAEKEKPYYAWIETSIGFALRVPTQFIDHSIRFHIFFFWYFLRVVNLTVAQLPNRYTLQKKGKNHTFSTSAVPISALLWPDAVILVPHGMPDKLTDFPLCVKCVSSHTTVFVACPLQCRYGDVRKTLATLLHRPFASVNIAPMEDDRDHAGPFPGDAPVPQEEREGFLTACILRRGDNGAWSSYHPPT
eukprot:gene6048-4349_t